ncbi:MAG: (2Fe-2S)-binding protein [Blastocatellia bacterium]|nr:(2Fe-2S)-binding protein [Blastocatellia bacterium]MCS7157224.1 (2Fe-2S)-binding protein [Blastocatellia bacterium]MCX7752313.1 (2Fe-2S)-binding protein [Blastocatellia bacterium]MDW8167196.1 (2Fe-2S)-binding protein [Acidobacteriota bacterium]
MPEVVSLKINEMPIEVPFGTTVLVALLTSGIAGIRRSVTGELRGPLCGIGVCFECRVTINGQPHCRSCQILCQNGMDVRTE